ncbi:Alkaline phosphatase [Microcystis panniformis FACHB-1757]|uniref:Alkaline phosphatase n=1 Tax=Microcystis panniformis FACHB-1757 TaxID=1638788 RepID=A0A0K1S707_9CHRO|nr:Alkaline phosphatase [Microcystis panniformis FACHB-1757]
MKTLIFDQEKSKIIPDLLIDLGSSRLCVIIFAYGTLKCLLGKTFRTILRKKLSV